ncbi:MAG: glucose-6-phosphate isomerase [Gammaproteobacteria bacterium]|nr:glucose-6-phosphate isomerase [Gammaproteobacteria bacterium]
MNKNSPGAGLTQSNRDQTTRIRADLASLREDIRGERMLDWFAADPARAESLTFKVAGLTVDFSKQRVNASVLSKLQALAASTGVEQAIQAMFAGAVLNNTENRAVLHVALRGSVDDDLCVDGENVSDVVTTELERMLAAVGKIRSGDWSSVTDRKITDVVNLGIGGSDLGPRMLTQALTPFHDGQLRVHFVANVDAHELLDTLQSLDAETTLIIVASKSFGTEETLANAKIAKNWLLDTGHSEIVNQQMMAVSSNVQRVVDFGIAADRIFQFRDWVGGRYSVWSVVGMPIALAVGEDNFRKLLRGANLMDRHFREEPLHTNVPVIMALISIWNHNFLGYGSQAVVPYYHFLQRLPQYLQQAEMESNGKGVSRDGEKLLEPCSPVVWGTAGTDAQHAYFQMLHQGPEAVPVDFVLSRRCLHTEPDSHVRLLTHAIAQSEALLCGRSESDSRSGSAAHKYCPGNRPSTTVLLEQADPENLGALLALYEHKIFVQGQIHGINSFDQFGVELGKQLASEIRPMMTGSAPLQGRDASTLGLMRLCRIQPGES